MNRLAITRVALNEKSNKKHLAYIMLDDKRDFVDFQVFQEEDTILNGIFVARVDNIIANINAAFVRISPKQVCYLPLDDVENILYVKKQSEQKRLSLGDEIVVQVIKDAVKTKDPVVSTQLTMSGKYCVLTTGNMTLGVSKKITGDAHTKLSKLLHEIASRHSYAYNIGIIIRTNALEATEEELKEDISLTINRFINLRLKSLHQCAFACLDKQEAPYIQKLKSVKLADLDYIYTDEEDIFESIETKLPYLKDKGILKMYKDQKVSLATLYNFRGSVDQLIEKRVWLKSGANIIIEQLETMTVIDINSGKNISKKETAILEINKEAAVEIARQLRLRNISGMIIIDFINMKSNEYMDELIAFIKAEIKKDDVPCTFIDVTKLGLVELTRKKTYKSLKEMIF